MAAAVAAMAAEEAEEALGLFTGIGLSEAKARETLRNGALSALLRRAVLQVRPPRARTLVSGARSPVPRHPDVTSGPGHAGNSLPRYRCHPRHPVSRSPVSPGYICTVVPLSPPPPQPSRDTPGLGSSRSRRAASALGTPPSRSGPGAAGSPGFGLGPALTLPRAATGSECAGPGAGQGHRDASVQHGRPPQGPQAPRLPRGLHRTEGDPHRPAAQRYRAAPAPPPPAPASGPRSSPLLCPQLPWST